MESNEGTRELMEGEEYEEKSIRRQGRGGWHQKEGEAPPRGREREGNWSPKALQERVGGHTSLPEGPVAHLGGREP